MHRPRGTILIVVLFVLMVLAMTAVSFGYRCGMETRLANGRVVKARLGACSRSALAIALAQLKANDNEFDHPAEPWCRNNALAEGDWLPEWSGGRQGPGDAAVVTDYQIVDEEGKLNVVYASSEALGRLGMDEAQIACLLDWMDSDSVVRSEGAEEDRYRGLGLPYGCKDRPLQVLDELLLVQGFGRGSYDGEDADHDGRLDACEDDGDLSLPADNADGLLQPGWVDLLRCVGDMRVNLNTAPEPVLRAMPISGEAVGQILAYRRYDEDSEGALEDHAFRSHQDVQQLQGLRDSDVGELAAWGKFRSSHFRVFVTSRHGPTGLEHRLECLVRMEGSHPRIMQWQATTQKS